MQGQLNLPQGQVIVGAATQQLQQASNAVAQSVAAGQVSVLRLSHFKNINICCQYRFGLPLTRFGLLLIILELFIGRLNIGNAKDTHNCYSV